MKKYYLTVYDRDGEVIAEEGEGYDTYKEADMAGGFHIDDPRYGSHEVYEEMSNGS
mgnify:FL=1